MINDTYESNSPKEHLSKESFSNQGQPVSKSSLIVEQKRDPEISPLFQKAVDDNDISSNQNCYFIKKGVLMRNYGPLKLLKEKILCSEDNSLNLLQYVSDFHTRFTKACGLARDNL